MPATVSAVSSILVTLVLILSLTHGQHVGERCTVDDSGSPGVCKLVNDCHSVYQALLAGITPSKGCGYLGFTPIVCCPTGASTVVTEINVQTGTTKPPPTVDSNRGVVARKKCHESIEALYGFKDQYTTSLNRKPVNSSRCTLKTRRLIVGGKKADPKEFPHMAAIGYERGEGDVLWLCGGTLISKKIVLSAAHCTYQSGLGNATWARVGDLNLIRTNDDAQPQTIKIVERIKHPEYKQNMSPSEYHDIAIMKLEVEVEYDDYVRPACLPVNWPDIGENNKAVASGWGRVDWSEEQGSSDLLKVTLRLVSYQSCNASFSDGSNSVQLPSGVFDEMQICAGEPGKDTCQGDSGGPLAVFNTINDCVYDVIGVTSIGRWCGSIIPGVYTRVYHYVPWIERAAWPEEF